MIIGNFNAHIEASQGNNHPSSSKKLTDSKLNAKELLQLSLNHQLSTLNRHNGCEGTYTKMTGNQKSTVDYMLANSSAFLYSVRTFVKIFDEGDFVTGSDPNLIYVTPNISSKTLHPHKLRQCRWIAPWKRLPQYHQSLSDAVRSRSQMPTDLTFHELTKIMTENRAERPRDKTPCRR